MGPHFGTIFASKSLKMEQRELTLFAPERDTSPISLFGAPGPLQDALQLKGEECELRFKRDFGMFFVCFSARVGTDLVHFLTSFLAAGLRMGWWGAARRA